MATTLPRGTDPLDPYRCVENNASEPIQAWLREQAAEAEQYFQELPDRQVLRDEFRSLYSLDTVGVPYAYQGRYFTARRRGNQDMDVLYVQDGLHGEPAVLLDQNMLSDDKTVTLSQWAPSHDGRLLAYGLSAAGNDKHDLRVKDVATGADLPDLIPADFYPSFNCWNADGTGFWYGKHDPRETMDEPKLHKRLYFHALGTTWQDDALVFGEGFDKESIFDATLSHDGRLLLILVYGQDAKLELEWSELYLRDLTASAGAFVRILEREPGVRLSVDLHRDRIYLTTEKNAPNKRILAIDAQRALAGSQEWRVVIPEGKSVIEGNVAVGDSLFVLTLENVCSVVRQYDLDGQLRREVPLPGIGSAGGFSCEEEGEELFFAFTSFVVPTTVCRLDLRTNELSVFAKAEAGFDTSDIETSQVWYASDDGTRIPMFLVHRKGITRNSDNPTLLYGYGGFDISLTPGFNKNIIPFVRRGGIYAVANLRGGGEFGKDWHEAGMRMQKQNVFDDFASAAVWLISNGYTCAERLAIQGGSNGGLLTLVTVLQNPDLVAAAVSQVPVADMLRYHLFDGGIYWIPDYGDPDDQAMREYLLRYSPYHNVVDGEEYPSVLFMTADGDDRVHPMHAYKAYKRFREANASPNPILLRVELKAGHGGASAISKYVAQSADMWAFVFDRLDMTA